MNKVTLVRILGVIALLAILVNIPVFRIESKFQKPVSGWPGGFGSGILAMELVKNISDVKKIVGSEDPTNRQYMAQSLNFDYVFIFFYWLLFMGMGILVVRPNNSWTFWIAALIMILGTIGALADVRENLYIASIIEQPLSGNSVNTETLELLLANLSKITFLKWGSVFLVSMLQSTVFLPNPIRLSWTLVIFFLFSVGGLVGFIGCFLWHQAIEYALLTMISGVFSFFLLALRDFISSGYLLSTGILQK